MPKERVVKEGQANTLIRRARKEIRNGGPDGIFEIGTEARRKSRG